MSKDQTIIIKRIKKGGHGHHGGAWKVAYADFVTAMMAFFLLLWLLNVTTDIERKGIADYFAPASVSKSESGSGGVFGGQTITAPGAEISDSAPPGLSNVIPQPDESERDRKEDPGSGTPLGPQKTAKDEVTSGLADKEKKDEVVARLQVDEAAKSEDQKKKEAEERKKAEEAAFKQAEQALRDAIKNSPEMAELEKSLLIDSTPEGLRIQIVDRDGYSLFPPGSPRLVEKSRRLMTLVGMVIARLPNKITVTGHTDNTPYRGVSRSNNWELSSERAFSAADVLLQAGVGETRLSAIIGKAATEPLLPDNPGDQQNRRISIVLLRKEFGYIQPPRPDSAAPAPAADTANAPATTPAPAAVPAPAQPAAAGAPAVVPAPASPIAAPSITSTSGDKK